MAEVHDFEVFRLQVDSAKDLPEWSLTAYRDKETGSIFIPAALTGSELMATMNASFDGVPVLVKEDHAYLELHYVSREYPDLKRVCAKVEKQIANHEK